jgi:hypothetical protein
MLPKYSPATATVVNPETPKELARTTEPNTEVFCVSSNSLNEIIQAEDYNEFGFKKYIGQKSYGRIKE